MNNIKRIIVDLDNTLIPWSNDYLEAVKKAVEEYNIPKTYEEMDGAYATYEEHYNNYSYENFRKHIKEQLGIEVALEFIKAWIEYLGDMALPATEELIETLKYLKEKYDLAVLTNGFTASQSKRLETAGIKEFFTSIYGSEKYNKPDARSFIEACGPYLPEECLMIGDNLRMDYEGAINAGLKAIHYNKKEESDGLTRVRALSELREIL